MLIFVSVMMMISLPGCGTLLDTRAVNRIEYFVEDSLYEFFDSRCTYDLNELCEDRYDTSEILDEQMELFRYAMSNGDFEIIDTTVKSNRQSGKCVVEFKSIPKVEDLITEAGSVDEYKEAIDMLDTVKIKISLKVVQDDQEQWRFANLDEFYDTFLKPYGKLRFIEEKVEPVNVDDGFFDSVYVDNVWYDPLLGNPLKGDSTGTQPALVNAIYFNKPVSMEVTAKLYKDDREIASKDYHVVDSVRLKLDFDAVTDANMNEFGRGSYRIELYSGDSKLAETTVLKVD